MLFSVLGWAAVLILMPATWFQVYRNFRRRSTEGVSSWMFITLFLGLVGLFALSLAEGAPIQIVANQFVGILGSGVVLLQMAIYRKEK